MFELIPLTTAESPFFFRTQDVDIDSNAGESNFWKTILFPKHTFSAGNYFGKQLPSHFTHNWKTSERLFFSHSISKWSFSDVPLVVFHHFFFEFCSITQTFSIPRCIHSKIQCRTVAQGGQYSSTFTFLQIVLSFAPKFYTSTEITHKLKVKGAS